MSQWWDDDPLPPVPPPPKIGVYLALVMLLLFFGLAREAGCDPPSLDFTTVTFLAHDKAAGVYGGMMALGVRFDVFNGAGQIRLLGAGVTLGPGLGIATAPVTYISNGKLFKGFFRGWAVGVIWRQPSIDNTKNRYVGAFLGLAR